MYTVSRTGNPTRMAAEIRALPGVAVPLVAAKALTFTAQKAQQGILAEMTRTFKGGATRYTLNSTRIETATPDKLAARVAVKDITSGSGNLPEDYLFPQVYAGARKEKRFERALRYAGILASGERAMPGQDATLDAFGNMSNSEIKKILTATRSAGDVYRRAGAKRAVGSTRAGKTNGYFAGQVGKTRGVWKAEGKGAARTVSPILIFVTKRPTYTGRLDFEEIARTVALREFEPTFRRLLAARKG